MNKTLKIAERVNPREPVHIGNRSCPQLNMKTEVYQWVVQTMAIILLMCGNCGCSKQSEEITNLRRAAIQGDVDSQFALAARYARGEGVSQNDVESAKWVIKAAEQGHAGAQALLGTYLKGGIGLKKDAVKAVGWYTQSAQQGHPAGQFGLGFCLGKGEGVPKNDVEAVTWYIKSAEQGYGNAQFAIGLYYAIGNVIPKDNIKSYMWLNLAAASGISDAADNRDITARSMTPEQIAEAQKMSSEWKPVGK